MVRDTCAWFRIRICLLKNTRSCQCHDAASPDGPLLNARVSFPIQRLNYERNLPMFRKVSLLASSLLVLATLAAGQETRHFTFHYSFTVKDVPAGEQVRI